MPTPAPLPAMFVAPNEKPAVTPKPVEPKAVKAPEFKLPTYSYEFDQGAVGNATLALKTAYKNIAGFKKKVCNKTEELEKIRKNVSLFVGREKWAHEEALKLRHAAVRYAKKSVLANITLMKAKAAMDDAYMAQKGAAMTAQRFVAHATNQRLRKIYSKKLLIDKEEELKKAEEALRVGQMAVNTAHANLAQAKTLAEQFMSKRRASLDKIKMQTHYDTEFAKERAVKQVMEDAYAEASPQYMDTTGAWNTRNRTNVPTWGSNAYGVGLDAGPPCHCVQGSPGCTCG